jgi:excisionase family DNA binding protein
MENKDYYSVKEIAEALGISRIAVFNKIKSGLIKAVKIGRMYAVPASEFENLIGGTLTLAQKKFIDQGVKKTVKEYGETLRLLGKE